MSANTWRSTKKTETIKSLLENGVGLAESTLKRKNLETLEAMLASLLDADTGCGGCDNGEHCGACDCCTEETLDEKVAEVTGEEATISEWFEKKVGTKWTYIYHNGELIAEVRNDSAKQVMAVLQASA